MHWDEEGGGGGVSSHDFDREFHFRDIKKCKSGSGVWLTGRVEAMTRCPWHEAELYIFLAPSGSLNPGLNAPNYSIFFPPSTGWFTFPQRVDVWLIKIEAEAAPGEGALSHRCIDVNISGCWCGFQHWPLLRRVSQPHCPCMTVTLMPPPLPHPRQFSLAPRQASSMPQPTTHPAALTPRCFPYLNNVSISTETAMFAFLSPLLSHSLPRSLPLSLDGSPFSVWK